MNIRNIVDEDELNCYADRDEPIIETCDVYAVHGNPDGSEHHACLDQLFSGDGFSVQEQYATVFDADTLLDMAAEAVASKRLNFQEYQNLTDLLSAQETPRLRSFYAACAEHPENFSAYAKSFMRKR